MVIYRVPAACQACEGCLPHPPPPVEWTAEDLFLFLSWRGEYQGLMNSPSSGVASGFEVTAADSRTCFLVNTGEGDEPLSACGLEQDGTVGPF